MADVYYTSPVPPFHTAVGAFFNTFTTFQDISPTPRPAIYGNALRAGSKLEVEAWGVFSNTATPTLALGFYFGTAAVVLAQSAAITTTTGATLWQWHLKYCGVVVAPGTAGSIVGQGIIDLGTSLTAMTTAPIPVTDAARTVAIDTTVNKEIGVGAAWGASSASNTIKTNDLRVLVLN